jgi:hypothetical protein
MKLNKILVRCCTELAYKISTYRRTTTLSGWSVTTMSRVRSAHYHIYAICSASYILRVKMTILSFDSMFSIACNDYITTTMNLNPGSMGTSALALYLVSSA